ncbi:hypothetical protein BU23DRAFT_558734 [Bimuria novae-zelandiae CBS 107.79]|uniref:RNA polymerase III RPC4-domain-containing protein n=1 Tax=Bimuria novae-zelandiae CBS 107.79 TaxID=1447943 RepID=A0A6A5UTQ0_9PLEO|nr:hypothetical protein BU23DRAFT_558734 [Bimuria novae-zelandiae CBS 107.79]
MPPKATPPRGRGRGRGRGTGRGGAASMRPATNSPAPPQQADAQAGEETGAAAATEPAVIPDPAALPKIEDGANADQAVAATVEASSADPLSVASTPAPAPESSAPPGGRLASVKSVGPPSRSASPAVRRGASSRGKKPILLPTNASRRSKEEREARNLTDLQRERERNKERDALAAKKQKALEAAERREKARSEGRGRGGHSGISAFFGGHRPDKTRASTSGYGGGSGSREIRVKNEDGDAGPSVKKERGGHMSSDDEDQDAEFPRKNIDFIELSSDENEPEPAPRVQAHLPIRIGRKPHKTKEFGINTDASIDASMPPADATSGSAAETSHKGKGKAKDLEITGERKSYVGMWQDSDSGGDANVKAEPISSDDESAQREQVGISDAPVKVEQSPERERKPKVLSKTIPNFQTEEERQEWERIQYNLVGMRTELGPPEEVVEAVDASGDVSMIDAVANASKPSARDDHTYLFQLPPIMPELLEPGQAKIKKEPSDTQPEPAGAAAPPAANGQPVIKKEDEFSDPRGNTGTGARFASGRVGKLRVHKSGRTTLDWGGTSYEVGPGNPSSFLQEVVSLETIPENKRVVPEDAGEALSFGRIKEKFVVTPNFSQLLR